MPEFAVSPEKNRWLKGRMKSLNIREEDILEKFVRSSGRGGQKVNKSSSCVYLKHLPSGIEIKCMKDRSQSINRFLARRELIERIEEMMGIKKTEVSKIRKKKAKARKRAVRKYRRAHQGLIGKDQTSELT